MAVSSKIVDGVIVLGTSNAKHLYEMNVEWEHPIRGTLRMKIEVHANNRNQAANFAKSSGYKVCDVNMVG